MQAFVPTTRRVLRAIARVVADTIRFGAIAVGAAPKDSPAPPDAISAAAGMAHLRQNENRSGEAKPPPDPDRE